MNIKKYSLDILFSKFFLLLDHIVYWVLNTCLETSVQKSKWLILRDKMMELKLTCS